MHPEARDKHDRSADSSRSKRRDGFAKDSSRLSLSPSVPSALPSPPVSSAPALSKMDKYFKGDYNPRLDLGEVPKEGLIGEVGWDNMLAILQDRGKKVSRTDTHRHCMVMRRDFAETASVPSII